MSDESAYANPWVEAVEADDADETEAEAEAPLHLPAGPSRPQNGVVQPEGGSGIGRFRAEGPEQLWVMGTHGDAGEVTVTGLLPGAIAARHRWPVRDSAWVSDRVLLVCRSTNKGLSSARRAAIEFASGALPSVQLVGLVIVADAPQKLTKDLRDLAVVVAGGVPETWQLPWIEDWRRGLNPPFDALPRQLRTTVDALQHHLSQTGAIPNE